MEAVSRLVVAGASGWVGGAVVAAARGRGVETIALSLRPGARSGSAGIDDLPRLLAPPGTTLVNAVGRTEGDRDELEEANVRSCLRLVDACAVSGARFLTVGSAAEVGLPLDDRVSERGEERPVNDYGRSKLAATELVRERREQGLRGTVARVFNVVGPGRAGVSPISDFAHGIRRLGGKDGVVESRDSTLVRDLSSLEWVAQRLVDLASVAGEEATVNVCSGRGTSYRELIVAMAAARGLNVTVVDTRPGGVKRVVGDPTLLLSLFPNTPHETLDDLARVALET